MRPVLAELAAFTVSIPSVTPCPYHSETGLSTANKISLEFFIKYSAVTFNLFLRNPMSSPRVLEVVDSHLIPSDASLMTVAPCVKVGVLPNG